MNIQRPSCAMAVALIATQVLGPAMLWAADQRGIRIEANRRVVVAALSGEQLTLQHDSDTTALHFRDAINAGDHITTGDRTIADVLIGNRAVVSLDHDTAAQLITVTDEQTTLQIRHGLVRVAAAASALGTQGLVTVQTPTGQVHTRGGIVRVIVDQPVGAAEDTPAGEARPYRAAYAPTTMMAAVTTRGDIIQVEEGTAEIPGAGPGGGMLTVKSGERVTLQSGQAGSISGFVNQADMRPGVLATAGHSQTPKEGRDNLVALQVEQATALGNALTGAAETGQGESGKKEDSKNVINGATGGVTLGNSSLVSSLFGGGSAANPLSSAPQERTGAGSGGANNAGFGFFPGSTDASITVNGGNGLLVFTRKDPIQAVWTDRLNPSCLPDNCSEEILLGNKITLQQAPSVTSKFTVAKELVLVGGTPNNGHGGIAPTQTLIVRGAAPSGGVTTFTNLADTTNSVSSDGLSVHTDQGPGIEGNRLRHPTSLALKFTAANSMLVVEEKPSKAPVNNIPGAIGDLDIFVGGTLGQFSNHSNPCPNCIAINNTSQQGSSQVDGAITATGSNVVLTGGVTLDQGTRATIGTTTATNNYFTGLSSSDAKFSGSLLSVINRPNGRTAVTVQDRLLGVYDGSTIDTDGGNKALLSVLDAKLKGPAGSIPLIDLAAGSHFDRAGVATSGSEPNVTVTSALVTRSTIPLDGALLEASAPLFALTQATMTTTSHFADLAGNQAPSLRLGDSLVALSASQLTIQNGNLLNLNAATATVNGYLFSLNNGSTLTLTNGALFSATNGSALNLNGNAFGVFGSGANTLSIDNNLCTAACFQVVNSANQPILLNGTPLQVAGATKNVVLPNNFNVFALAPGAPKPTINIGADDALFKVDGTSTVTIKGTPVVKP